MLTLSLVLFGLGVLNVIMKNVLEEPDQTENRIEWFAGLVLQIHFVVMYLAWRATGIGASVRIREPGIR